MKNLAARLAWARDQANLSQQALADRVGVAQSTIGNLESGLRQTSRNIASIAAALGVDALWLAEGKGSPHASSAKKPVGENLGLETDPYILEALELLRSMDTRERIEAIGALKVLASQRKSSAAFKAAS